MPHLGPFTDRQIYMDRCGYDASSIKTHTYLTYFLTQNRSIAFSLPVYNGSQKTANKYSKLDVYEEM